MHAAVEIFMVLTALQFYVRIDMIVALSNLINHFSIINCSINLFYQVN